MDTGERRRVAVAGVVIALALLGISARLFDLQVLQHHEARAALRRQASRVEPVPAARGSILDRDGRLMACDRPVLEARAEWWAPVADPAVPGIQPRDCADVVGRLSAALARDRDRVGSDDLRRLRELLAERITRGARWPEQDRTAHRRGAGRVTLRRTDFLVTPELDHHGAWVALQEAGASIPGLRLYTTPQHVRVYPEGDALAGVVGSFGEIRLPDGKPAELRTGFERLVALDAGADGSRGVRIDVRARPHWTSEFAPPGAPARVHTTLDAELQQVADAELRAAAAEVERAYADSDAPGPPDWGALLLVDVASGELLAMASYAADAHPRAAEFAPTRRMANPGSVMKPLLFAIALESGKLDWDGPPLDCTPNAGGRSWYIPTSTRKITDEHSFTWLRPAEILAFSSNIGAVQVGRRLSREEHARYLDVFGLGRPTGIGLPDERSGRIEGDVLRCGERQFSIYLAPSYSIGYDMSLTPLQVTAAYLNLLSGRRRALRLLRAVELDGVRHEYPVPALDPTPLCSARTLALLREAMVQVVTDTPNATGRTLAQWLAEQGLSQPGVIAGKTGTSQYFELRRGSDGTRERVVVRTSSFAGFAPAAAPRYLAFCMLQKTRAVKFFGGRYAAPPVGRLLLRALAQPHDAPDSERGVIRTRQG